MRNWRDLESRLLQTANVRFKLKILKIEKEQIKTAQNNFLWIELAWKFNFRVEVMNVLSDKEGENLVTCPGSHGTNSLLPFAAVNLRFCIVKTYSQFLIYSSSRSLVSALKECSSERKRIVLLMGSVQISPCGFVCERRETWC